MSPKEVANEICRSLRVDHTHLFSACWNDRDPVSGIRGLAVLVEQGIVLKVKHKKNDIFYRLNPNYAYKGEAQFRNILLQAIGE